MPQKTDKLASEIGARVASRRKQLGLTQEQAAERAGLTQQFFACVETGTKNIRAESLIKVSKALNISADYLLTGTVSTADRNRVAQLLEPLDDTQFSILENIVQDILRFGGYVD